ncbi:LysE family translocator [Aliiroseovarius marinus]|uniref:LysE family translocator n=1 Tax=Aliiroseovarius marinus TaxID=2500159 RepID=UPI00105D37D0|nr:LysE family transporter [Aliiroseovarius marinus]
MVELALFLKALLLGVAVAAPLGPIGALCINRTLERGFFAGVAGGIGTSLADGLYASLAAIGFAAFSVFLAQIDTPLRLVGGAFMLWLGYQSFRPKPPRHAAKVSARDLVGTIAATFVLTITNPMTILSFAALFAGLGLAATSGYAAALPVVIGVTLGSLLWWVTLSGGVALARHKLPDGFALWVSRLSGMILIGFGIWAVSSVAI